LDFDDDVDEPVVELVDEVDDLADEIESISISTSKAKKG